MEQSLYIVRLRAGNMLDMSPVYTGCAGITDKKYCIGAQARNSVWAKPRGTKLILCGTFWLKVFKILSDLIVLTIFKRVWMGFI